MQTMPVRYGKVGGKNSLVEIIFIQLSYNYIYKEWQEKTT